MPTVEAHIVTYNSAEVIGACLSTVLKFAPTEPGIDFRVVLRDNASSDGTADLVAAEYPEVELIRGEDNIYYGPACNELAQRSDADYLFVLNPDTEVDGDVITPLLQVLLNEPDVSVVLPTIVDTGDRVQSFVQRFPNLAYELALLIRGTRPAALMRAIWDPDTVVRRTRDTLPFATSSFAMCFIWSTAWLIPRATALEFPFSAEFPMYDTDLELSARMADKGLRARYLDRVIVRHIGGASSNPASKLVMERGARARYYRLHGGPLYSALYRALVFVLPRLVQAKRQVF